MRPFAAIVLFCLTCACKAQHSNQVAGTLIALVNIGPVCPQEPCNLSPAQKIAFYKEFNVIISDSTGIERHRLAIDTSGLIRKSLVPGNYSAGIKPINYPEGASLDLVSFRILPGKESKIDLFFDTGLR